MHAILRATSASLSLALLSMTPNVRAAADLCPEATVKITVTFPPGGAADGVARLLAPALSATTGKQFIVDNRPGASGAVGTGAVASAPADGCNLLLAFDNFVITPAFGGRVAYQWDTGFTPLTLVGSSPQVVAAPASGTIKTMQQFVEAARKQPDTVSYGSVGQASSGHLAMSLLEIDGKFNALHVPYRGGAPMLQDLAGGQLGIGIGSVALVRPQVDGGRLIALATTGATRSPALPNVPTAAELGISPNPSVSWWGFVLKAGTPAPVVQRMQRELVAAIEKPEMRAKLTQLGLDVQTTTPEQFAAFMRAEFTKWSNVIRTRNIKAD